MQLKPDSRGLRDAVVELYRRTATSVPKDVMQALAAASKREAGGSNAKGLLGALVKNAELFERRGIPVCQDTGTPVFYVEYPHYVRQSFIIKCIRGATSIATKKVPLRPNALEPLGRKNSGNNLGDGFPVIHMHEAAGDRIRISLLLKGGGSENVSAYYRLPDEGLNAKRDYDGIVKCAIDAVYNAQGRGCPPYILGIAVGGTLPQCTELAQLQIFRELGDNSPDVRLSRLEREVVARSNELGIGPMGLGGKTTVLGANAAARYTHPASYFVCVSLGCWATRRGAFELGQGGVRWTRPFLPR